jgi:hypothetical protein
MSSFGVLSGDGATELSAVAPVVYVDNEIQTTLFCLSIEDGVGIVPGKAVLEYRPGTDVTGPITLTRYSPPWKYGSRVVVKHGDTVLFMGALMRRQDDGQADRVTWIALDDRALLDRLPIRGALVYDGATTGSVQKVKFLPRYECRMNPEGYWNCVGVSLGGEVYPVFSADAQYGTTYQKPDEAYVELAEGVTTCWTPRRALMYLWLLANATGNILGGASGRVAGIRNLHWRSIYGSSRLKWQWNTITTIKGTDPTDAGTDPLDRKLPDMSFRGERILRAVEKALETAGTHGIRMDVAGGSSWSALTFYPKGWTGLVGAAPVELRLERGGNAADINTAYDFTASEDVSEVAESVLVEGAPVMVETSLSYQMSWDSTNRRWNHGLSPAWTRGQTGEDSNEELAWRQMVNGSNTSTPGTYAKYPPIHGQTAWDGTWLDANGSAGRPYALPRTLEAAGLASMYFPRVWRAWYVNPEVSEVTKALAGATRTTRHPSGEFDAFNYARTKMRRPVDDNQLQFLLKDPVGGTDVVNRLLVRYPLRVQVNYSGTSYMDVPWHVPARVTGDGLLWLEGLDVAADGSAYCVYAASITSPLSCISRRVKINAAFPMDHRVHGYADIGGAENSVFAQSFNDDCFGPPLLYIDSPNAYREHHQVESYPVSGTFTDGTTTAASPLTRILPPGSERVHATRAAERRLASARQPRRASTWRMIGIRPEYRAGQWLGKVHLVGGSDGADYTIQAPIESVVFDFKRQETVVGGLLSVSL